MKDSYVLVDVLENKKLTEDIYLMKLKGNFKGQPGQFYMFRSWNLDPILSRPLSIADKDDESITFLYQVVGKGTGLMKEIKVKDKVQVFGPLGQGFTVKEFDKVAIVAGGIGIAPMLYLAKKVKAKIDLYFGFRDQAYYTEDFKDFCESMNIALESQGKRVTDIFEDKNYDMVYACGPNAMLENLKKLSDPDKMELSLESHMACGMGACCGCAVETRSGIKRVCMEGPVFNASEVFINA